MTTIREDDDFRQLAGRFDAPIAPSARFTEQLRQQIAQPAPVQPRTLDGLHQGIPPNPPQAPARPASAHRSRRWPALGIAAAILLLVTSVSAIALYRQPGDMQQLAFQPVTPTVPTEFNFGGDPGLTQDLGPVAPEMRYGRQHSTIPTSQGLLSGITFTGNVDGNSIFFTDLDRKRDRAFIRYDLERQEVTWERSIWVSGTIASDGRNVYVVAGDPDSSVQESQLLALDIATGETVWEGPALANRPYMTGSVTIAGSTVYAADFAGNVVSVNAADGSVNWESPDVSETPTIAETEGLESSSTWPQLPVNDTYVYVTRPDMTIAQLDRQTGNEVSRIVIDDEATDIQSVKLMANDDYLVVSAYSEPSLANEETSRYTHSGHLLIVDSSTLKLVHSVPISNFYGNAVMHNDTVYLPTITGSGQQVEIMAIDLESGSVDVPIANIESMAYASISISGGILMATGDPSGIWFFDLATGEEVGQVELGIENMESPFQMPVQMWGSKPLVITATGEVYVVTDDDPPPAEATPGA